MRQKSAGVANNNHASIILESVTKTFSAATTVTPALSEITATIERGQITGLVGPDGAGKTTLIRIIAGLLTRSQGIVTVAGLDPEKDTAPLRAILGYMPQKFGLYDDLTVLENLRLYGELRGVSDDERTEVFKKLLDFTDLNEFTKRPAGKLSGGMKQKLGLACALLGHPQILLLDEPSVGVDPISRRELWKMVNVLVAQGITVIWSTSYLEEAELCSNVLLMNEGKLVYAGKPHDLTQTIGERSMQLQHIEGNHRLVLQRALRMQEVIDGVIQGENVRLVLREAGKIPDVAALKAGPNAELVAVKPRFEDAFIDILGGGPGGESVLTKVMPQVESHTSDVVIEVKDLTKKFGSFIATNKISFKVKRGEIFGLLGPNGAGKSTTFKMLCGLLTPTSGYTRVMGFDLQKSTSVARQHLGYMSQKFSLYGDLSVKQNLEFFSGIYGLSGKAQAKKIAEMVEAFDLNQFLTVTTSTLPLGFKQRLALACALMHEPAVLFLDEPTSGVDPITRREFWTHINGLVQKGVTVLVTTHFMDEAEYCDRIGLVYRGQLIASGTPDELKQLATNDQQFEPTMEDAFIFLVNQHDKNNQRVEQTSSKISLSNVINGKSMNRQQISYSNAMRRLLALCKKEFFQIVRDPSSILMAFILPIVMLLIYGYGLNLDTTQIRLGLVMEDKSAEARRFALAFFDSPYIIALPMVDAAAAAKQLTAGNIRGFVRIQPNFALRLKQADGVVPIQIVTDGSEPNTADFVTSYAKGAIQIWQTQRGSEIGTPSFDAISVEQRYWFNPSAISRYYLIPGSIAIIMTVIGALLTSLVVAREWERGTMEALLSTSVTRHELLYSKLLPYYLLGIASMAVCTMIAITVMGVPFHGSFWLLFVETTLFLGSALGLGLLLSTVTRNQFNAAQGALNIAFLPAVMLSGFVYEITSMPPVIRALTYLFPARYFVSSLQTIFLAGNIGWLLFKDGLFLFMAALIFLSLTARATRLRID